MKFSVYSEKSHSDDLNFIESVFSFLIKQEHEVMANVKLAAFFPGISYYEKQEDLKKVGNINFFLSLGGDGTLLKSSSLVGNLDIPIVGINTGRIGFLTGVNKSDFEKAYHHLIKGDYTLENRTLLHLETDYPHVLPNNFALNDITLHASGEELSSIKVWINDRFLNTYWANGLIIATPTGSTAYSLSCGGPIIVPDSQVNVITPIASHSLSVRPIVVSSEDVIRVEIGGRADNFLLTLDHYRAELPNPAKITVSKENFTIKTVRFDEKDFFTVIREKLMWGLDRRNK